MDKISTTAGVVEILSNIKFGESGVMLDKMELKWDLDELRDRESVFSGWRLRLSFLRPDTDTGKIGRGYGRWELLENPTNETTIVKTCWLLLELLVLHELRESFKYREVRVFDPHATIDTLYYANKDNR